MHSTIPNVRGIVALAIMVMTTPLVLATPAKGDTTLPEAIANINFDKLGMAADKLAKVDKVYPGPGLPSLESLGLTSAELFDFDHMETVLANKTGAAVKLSPFLTPILQGRSEPGPHGLRKRFPDQCLNGFGNVGYGSQAGIIACYYYLQALGTQSCGAGSGGVTMCYATQSNGFVSYISGAAVNGQSSAASYCRDVATGAAFGLNNCVWCPAGWGDCVLRSISAAWGNGDLAITNWGNVFP